MAAGGPVLFDFCEKQPEPRIQHFSVAPAYRRCWVLRTVIGFCMANEAESCRDCRSLIGDL